MHNSCTFEEYMDQVEARASNRSINPQQRQLLQQAWENGNFEYLGPEGAEARRDLFNSVKSDLVAEWEAQTRQSWPTYRKPIFSLRMAECCGRLVTYTTLTKSSPTAMAARRNGGTFIRPDSQISIREESTDLAVTSANYFLLVEQEN